MTAATDARLALGDLVLHARSLALRLRDAEAVQWMPSPRPLPRAEPTGRAKGNRPSDPTADVALDEARLALRSAVREGEVALAEATARLTTARRRVERSIDAWYGAEPAPDQDGTTRV
jgi:hypothetical protein